MGVGPHKGFLLRMFGAMVTQAFEHTPYHVGSSLTQKRGWRDVDVRLIVPDEEYDALYSDDGRRKMLELAFTTLGNRVTDLPIDFQIQQQTAANEEFSGVRSALILTDQDLPVARTSQGGNSAN